MAGAIVTEGIFNIPGVGARALPGDHARRGADRRLHRHGAGLIYMLDNLLVDLLYAVLDPRIRYV